jgi:hypothetical protein
LFLFADSAIVARLGTTPLGGLGVASQALSTLVGIAIFLAYAPRPPWPGNWARATTAPRSGRASTACGWPPTWSTWR